MFEIDTKSQFLIQEFSISVSKNDPECNTTASDTEEEIPEQVAMILRKYKPHLEKHFQSYTAWGKSLYVGIKQSN